MLFPYSGEPLMDWQKYAWVNRGKRRQQTLEVLNKSANPLTINAIHEKVSIAISQTSVIIAELEGEGLIECLNSQDKIGKLYRITEEGKEIITTLTKEQH
jgi:DNA-binding MarR family transcriptional regulator